MVCVILDSPGGLWLRTGERSIKGMLKYKMLILQERKPVNEIRGIHWHMNWELLKDRIGKPKANHCLSEMKPTKGKVSSWLLFEKNLQLSHSVPNRPLFLTKCFMKWFPFELRAIYWESYRMNRFFFSYLILFRELYFWEFLSTMQKFCNQFCGTLIWI